MRISKYFVPGGIWIVEKERMLKLKLMMNWNHF